MGRRLRSMLLAAGLPFLVLGFVRRLSDVAGSTSPLQSTESEPNIIISEVAWGGTAASASDEWIELYNAGDATVLITGWTLGDSDGDVAVQLTGQMAPGSFYLLERSDDGTVSDIPADQIFIGTLDNNSGGGDRLLLQNGTGSLIDSANGDGGLWPAGEGSPGYASMERMNPLAVDEDASWVSNDGLHVNGLDVAGNPLRATPGQPNSSWSQSGDVRAADLVLEKDGPTVVEAGTPIRFRVQLANLGTLSATGTVLTDTLPDGVAYIADDAGFPLTQVAPETLIWQVGTVPPATTYSFNLTVTAPLSWYGPLTNTIRVGSAVTESNPADNEDSWCSQVSNQQLEGGVLIDGLLYDGYEYADADEAVRLFNRSRLPIDLGGWSLGDGGAATEIPAGTILLPGRALWMARDAGAFQRQFGFAADLVLEPWPGFANTGDEALLQRPDGSTADLLVYKGGNTQLSGWSGPALQPYRGGGLFAEEGQILYRQRDPRSGWPVQDSNTALDWAQSTEDVVAGRKVQYPGWSLDDFFFPAQVTETAKLTVAVAPDNAYQALLAEIASARHSLQIETLTLENIGLAEALAGAASRGVSVTVLLEGDPVAGVSDQERYACQLLDNAGGACWFMVRDDEADIHDRYRYLHAKFVLMDGRRLVISSENLSPDSMPYDDKSDGTWGRRGLLLITDATAVVRRAQELFADDFDAHAHADLLRWQATDAKYGAPPPEFRPITITGGITYTVHYTTPATFSGRFAFELSQSPENSLRWQDSLLALVSRAGTGDRILVQQLSEQLHWGGAAGTVESDPNPRLEAFVDAARRGAQVRLLLDGYFDDEEAALSNRATCVYVEALAEAERLDLACTLGNPTGLGIHNKMVLLQIGGQGWVHVGSLNGSELSHKGNRELALQVQSNGAFAYLEQLFIRDWPRQIFLPLVGRDVQRPAAHPLISELLYDPTGLDDAEFVELVNPTPLVIDLSGWSVGDAVLKDDYEDVRRFPSGTALLPGRVLLVALRADAFREHFGDDPDFEIYDTCPAVPDLLHVPDWGAENGAFQLGNSGDELLLRDPIGRVIDAVVYGAGAYPGVVACPLVGAPGHSLERFPYWQDTDDCSRDFRDWPFPSPGQLPRG